MSSVTNHPLRAPSLVDGFFLSCELTVVALTVVQFSGASTGLRISAKSSPGIPIVASRQPSAPGAAALLSNVALPSWRRIASICRK